MNIRCTFCGRFYNKKKDMNKCHDCEEQFQSIMKKINLIKLGSSYDSTSSGNFKIALCR